MLGPDSMARRLWSRVGVGAATAAAVSALPPDRPLKVDPFTLLVLAGLTAIGVQAVLDDRATHQLPIITGALLLAALIGAALHELHRPLTHPRLFTTLVLVGMAGTLVTLRRPPRNDHGSDPAPRWDSTVNGRWALQQPLPGADQGGFSDPWLGVDLNRDQRQVVVNLESPRPERRHDSRRRLEREQRVLARIQSRWIVQFHDGGRVGSSGRRYIVVDYHPVGSLAKRLQEAQELRLTWVVNVVSGVLRALVVLHEELPRAHRPPRRHPAQHPAAPRRHHSATVRPWLRPTARPARRPGRRPGHRRHRLLPLLRAPRAARPEHAGPVGPHPRKRPLRGRLGPVRVAHRSPAVLARSA